MRRAFVVTALLVAFGAGCGKQRVRGDGDFAQQDGAIDDVLLAWLSSARALHHEADLQEDAKDPRAAIATLERLVAKPKPRVAPEIDEVLADTRARLADLRSQLGDFDAAGKDLETGLALAPAVSYYRGHLLEVRGVVEERRSKALAAKGDVAGAERAREAAMKAYEEAIAVHDAFIKKSAEDSGR